MAPSGGKLPKAERDAAQAEFQYDPHAMTQYVKARALGLSHHHAMLVGAEIQGHVAPGTAYQQMRLHAPPRYDDIKDTEARLPEERKYHAAHFKDAPPYIQAALRKARAITGLNPKSHPRGSFYIAALRQIGFRPRSKEKTYPGYTGAVWRHEYGHHIDYEMSGQQRPQSFTRRDALMQDRAALVRVETAEQKAERIKATGVETQAVRHGVLGNNPRCLR